jgi:transposase
VTFNEIYFTRAGYYNIEVNKILDKERVQELLKKLKLTWKKLNKLKMNTDKQLEKIGKMLYAMKENSIEGMMLFKV